MNVAQTNLQLYAHVSRRADFPDIEPLRRGYDLAAALFAGVYRASGKPFIAHLVGTADILVRQGAALPLVLAGLLHAAYAQGDFGDGVAGMTDVRRRGVRRAIGEDAERLVARYTTMPWKSGRPPEQRDLPALDSLDRDVFVIRLANELEDLGDFGILHYRDAEIRRAHALEALPVWIAWARALSADRIAAALEASVEPLRAFRAPEELRTDHAGSYRAAPVFPPTIRSRVGAAVHRVRGAASRLRARLRSASARKT